MLKKTPTALLLFKKHEEEWLKPPKVKITPRFETKEDKKKAKLLQGLINYQFKHNTNGITNKYMQVMMLAQKKFLMEEVNGIQVGWDATERAIKKIVEDEISTDLEAKGK